MAAKIVLRPVTDNDLRIFFEQQLDPEANYMAAFTAADPADEAAFGAHWAKILGDERVMVRTILSDDQVAGYIARFERFSQPEVSYWLGRPYWGQGIASGALAQFLGMVTARPLYARAVQDNSASIRVLEKCGFLIVGEARGYANARGGEVAEFILALGAS